MKARRPFDLSDVDIEDYFFIAHLFDRILMGRANEYPHDELMKAIHEDEIVEVHFFNEEKEIYAVRINDELMVYEPLEHQAVCSEKVITRSYQLEKIDRRVEYNTLTVKEYIEYDPDDHLAYVDRTILYRLEKR